jgi:hypothetical protein
MAEKKKEGFSLMKLLGAGLAEKAGKLMQGRKAQIEKEVRQAVDGSMRKRKKQP